MKRIALILFLGLSLGATVLSGCAKKDDPAPAAQASLYTRLGGVTAIEAVTDKFLANVLADSRINGSFAAAAADSYRATLLRNNLVDQICAGSGGPCHYKGKTMLEAHRGMNITDAEFNALVEDLVAALDFFNVPTQEKNDLLAILGPMRSDIVGR